LRSAHAKAAAVHRMLMKLTPVVDFTNILQAAFTHADPKRAKKYCKTVCLFALLGSSRVKAVCKTLMKLN